MNGLAAAGLGEAVHCAPDDTPVVRPVQPLAELDLPILDVLDDVREALVSATPKAVL